MGVECTMLLFCYKLKYPNLVHLLRGNHECTSISRIYGFHDECVQRFNADIWKEVKRMTVNFAPALSTQNCVIESL